MYIERVENGEAGILQSAAGIFEGLGIAVLDRFFSRVARAAVEAFAGAPRVLAQGYTRVSLTEIESRGIPKSAKV